MRFQQDGFPAAGVSLAAVPKTLANNQLGVGPG